MRNQAFRLIIKDKTVYMKIVPPEDGGAKLDVNMLTFYLGQVGFEMYNLKELTDALNNMEKPSAVKVGTTEEEAIDEIMDCDISFDKMKAVCTFFPPTKGGKTLSKDDIMGILQKERIRYGINEKLIDSIVAKKVYFKKYLLAKGQPLVEGKDGYVKYNFNTNPSLRPKQQEDGSVDYKNLDTISQAKEGDVVAEIFPEEEGTPGVNVFEEQRMPKAVKAANVTVGNGVSMTEDGRKVIADVTGHIMLDKGKIVMSEVFEVASDVDNSTGNLSYAGSVTIKGNVTSGFKVTASGNIEIEGMIEDAYVEATGQVIVKGGIMGKGKGTIKAGENVIVKYIENAKVIAGGYVETDIILNGDVSAGIDVRVAGKKGLINGGTVQAGHFIEANNVGTTMGSPATLMVGVNPQLREEHNALVKELTEAKEKLDQLKATVVNFSERLKKGEQFPQDKILYVQNLAEVYKEEQKKLAPKKERLDEIKKEMADSDKAYVIVSGDANQGTMISISDAQYTVRTTTVHSRFVKKDGEVTIASIE
ncbi:hypothetical protein SAMN04487761_10190 [Lachnospiraceae bacterium C7]|nr:hypothetical protein SAMN04487761_10190 [Lachnospiraceae bacterium C7]